MTITHPTGSAAFAATLDAAGAPAPWRLDEDEEGAILATNGAVVLHVDPSGSLRTREAVENVALAIIVAVNTCAGLKAVARVMASLLVVYWEWTEETPHAGARFWSAHATENDGRLRDWPGTGLRPLGAAQIEVTEGVGLELLPPAAASK